MAKNVFSVPIFFIVFRETLEAAIIVSVLLGLAEQIVHDDPGQIGATITSGSHDSKDSPRVEGEGALSDSLSDEDDLVHRRRLIRKLRIQIFLGAGLGLFLALAIGAAFIAVWFTQASNLWSKSEELWEGIFELIACLMIFVMGVTMLKMDRAKAKWRVKLERAFEGKRADGKTSTGKWALFILPLITVLREGMEAVVFVGGVSLGQPATSIPLAAIVGLICGLVCGFLIYFFASRTTLTVFLIAMTNLLLLIGAGLFSRSVGSFERNAFNHLLGADIDDAGGSGPGSYRVQGNVWHLDCCNPEDNLNNNGWSVFNALFGWTNSATIGTVLSYVFYWLAVIVTLVFLKVKEGRSKFFGYESATGIRRRLRREQKEAAGATHDRDMSESKEEVKAEKDVQVLPK
ncbi:Ftr1 protein [Desarmillaria tabescens]|uniref:Ftr1 protein n=1 Tax=Armillaria tabescens TaxID=1929756 RepID=A0AA39J464_ARMTA|nr:Ftr1 protein [Desarmillaria tabescens]KAK0435816.1 Ftr1 protein [Desarmillaria tabescens]